MAVSELVSKATEKHHKTQQLKQISNDKSCIYFITIETKGKKKKPTCRGKTKPLLLSIYPEERVYINKGTAREGL